MPKPKSNKHILNIKVEFTQKDSYSFRNVNWAINFWKGYIDQISGHKVLEIRRKMFSVQGLIIMFMFGILMYVLVDGLLIMYREWRLSKDELKRTQTY